MESKIVEAFEDYLNGKIITSCQILEGKSAIPIDSITEYKYQLGRLRTLEQVRAAFNSFKKNGVSGED